MRRSAPVALSALVLTTCSSAFTQDLSATRQPDFRTIARDAETADLAHKPHSLGGAMAVILMLYLDHAG